MHLRPTRIATALAALILVMAPTATAGSKGKGGAGSSASSMTLVVLDSSDGLPHWGQSIRFDVTTSETTQPHVSVDCYQGPELVYVAATGYYDGYAWPWTQTMVLSSGAWTGGAADCQAELYKLDYKRGKTVLGRLAFHVYA